MKMNTMMLTLSDGTTKEVELVAKFKLDKFNDDYIIYRDNSEYYAAKFIEEGDNTKLITDLSDIEKKALTRVYDLLVKGSGK